MAQQTFGPLRSRAGRKPWPQCPDVAFYHCIYCDTVYERLGFPKTRLQPVCCGEPTESLTPFMGMDLPGDIQVDYKIVGGFNQSAVQFFWDVANEKDIPEWVLLKTFTGGYIKYLPEGKRPPLVFPLSDEDAYVYCDRQICEECLFRCKRGFVLYVYFKTLGILEFPLEKMADYFNAAESAPS
jgi:hypothetical protein